MRIAVLLNKQETSKIGDKDSMIYKAIVTLIKELKEKIRLDIAVIGEEKDGKLFEIDINKKRVIAN